MGKIVLSSFRINTRLVLITLLYAVPFSGLTTWLVTKSFNANIEIAQLEQNGDALQRPVEEGLNAVSRYHLHLTGAHAGDSAALRQSVDEALQKLGLAYSQYGESLQFTPQGLSS